MKMQSGWLLQILWVKKCSDDLKMKKHFCWCILIFKFDTSNWLSPSLSLCRFASKNRERSSAGQNPQVANHVTTASWLGLLVYCLCRCFVVAAALSLPHLCTTLSLLLSCTTLSLAVTDGSLGLVALPSSGFWPQPACLVHYWHQTFNLFISFTLTECLWRVNPLFLIYFCFLYFVIAWIK